MSSSSSRSYTSENEIGNGIPSPSSSLSAATKWAVADDRVLGEEFEFEFEVERDGGGEEEEEEGGGGEGGYIWKIVERVDC